MPTEPPSSGPEDPDGSKRSAIKAAGPGRQFFVPAPEPKARPRPPAGAGSKDTPSAPRPKTVPTARPKKAKARSGGNGPRVPKTRGPDEIPQPKPARKRRRKRLRWVLLIPAALIALLAFGVFKAYSAYNKIDRIDLSDVLDPVSGDSVNYLLVGSDSRAELDPEGKSGVTGSRSDTIIVLRTSPSGSKMMSIPRDLWVEIADTNKMGRINGAYNSGPANLVQTVKRNLDLPINHYMEVGFGSFASLVDAVGGVTIDFPHPAFDTESGLNVEQAGPVKLDGAQALAYARSRHYTEVIDGKKVLEPTADLGRQQRQQTFLRTALAEVGATRNPLTLINAADAMSSELIVDSGLGFRDAMSFVRKLGGDSPETVVLPTIGTRKGRAAVVVLDEPAAQVALQQFR